MASNSSSSAPTAKPACEVYGFFRTSQSVVIVERFNSWTMILPSLHLNVQPIGHLKVNGPKPWAEITCNIVVIIDQIQV